MNWFKKSEGNNTKWNLPQLITIVKWVTFAISLLKWVLDSLQTFPKPPLKEVETK